MRFLTINKSNIANGTYEIIKLGKIRVISFHIWMRSTINAGVTGVITAIKEFVDGEPTAAIPADANFYLRVPNTSLQIESIVLPHAIDFSNLCIIMYNNSGNAANFTLTMGVL